VVLKDELCSREHAEISFAEGHWRLRDLKSLNGTRLNNTPLDGEGDLHPGDEFQVGRTRFIFVFQLEELPSVPMDPDQVGGETISIKKRMSQSRFLTPHPQERPAEDTPDPDERRILSHDLMHLYRLGLEMGAA